MHLFWVVDERMTPAMLASMSILEATGINGQVVFDGQTVSITRKGFVAWVGHGGAGSKVIPVKSIAAVQFKPATSMVNGFVTFTVHGEVSRSKAGRAKANAANDENGVVIRKSHMEAMQPLVDAVQAAIVAPAPGTATAPDPLDQIARLAELHKQGILTDEEFATKKASLLA